MNDDAPMFIIAIIIGIAAYLLGMGHGIERGIKAQKNGQIVWYTNSVGKVAFTLGE